MKNISRQLTIKYAFLQSTFWISQCTIYSFAAVFLQYKNFNNTHIGIVLSLSAIISIILQPMISAFADKSKNKTVRNIILTLLLIVFALALILNIWNNSFLLIAIIFVLINAIHFTLISLLNSFALEFMNNGYPFNFGLARGTASIAFAITSFLLGHAVERFSAGVILPFFLISYVFLFISAYMYRIKDSNNPSQNIEDNSSNIEMNDLVHTNDADTHNPPASVLGFFLKYKKYTFLLIGVSMAFYAHSLINTYLINIMENVGGGSSDMGLSLTIAAALELPMMASFVFLLRKAKCSTLIKISAFFFFVKTAIVWLAPNVIAVHFSQAFQMLSFALFTPASVFYVNSIINVEDRNKGQAMLGVATLGVAGTVAYLTGGKILDVSGVSDMLIVATIVSFVGFIVICFSTED